MRDFYPSRTGGAVGRLPRRDPVLYSEWRDDAPIGKDEAEQFERDGYLILNDVFSAEEVVCLRSAGTTLLRNPDSLDPKTIVFEPGSRDVRSVFRIHRQSEVMARLAVDARLAGLAGFLLGDDVYVHQSRLNYKPGFEGKEFYWHSDFETWHAEDGMPRMRALSISVLLARNTGLNGALMLMPGSHKRFLQCPGETPDNHYLTSLRKQEVGVPTHGHIRDCAEEFGIVTATGDAGTVIVFDCNIIHGSNGNISPWPRSNAFFVFNALSNRLVAPFAAPGPRPEFIAAREDVRKVTPETAPLIRKDAA